ncbi:sigma-E factor negative regulatory protein [Paracandidimonas soli]|uniref:Sigma-E factor negative regulatory protein RseA n=1 Tax=Paracandidimonas soli TaxID=1917182 RepID=A0A4V2VRM9_9BURK|nr:sigma-E factor negative regulatory protein [Paracandidimonas soli]TCU99119.1 sigma-E factor negative regulatory protein RseA [Paracandidimonas soli]
MEAARQTMQQADPEVPASLEAAVSAWVDGEEDIRTEDTETPYGRHLWETYHLIGDVMRNESLAIRPSEFFYARLSHAIDEEPSIVAPIAWHRRRQTVRLGLSGVAVAAAVAAVAWVALPYLSGAGSQPAADMPPMLATAGEETRMQDYLEAHRELTGSGSVMRASFSAGEARP